MRKTIVIAEDFTRVTGGREPNEGSGDGRSFREDFLVPALKQADEVHIDMRGCQGLAWVFLDEAFGGLIRENKFSQAELQKKLTFNDDKSYRTYVSSVWDMIDEASQEINEARQKIAEKI